MKSIENPSSWSDLERAVRDGGSLEEIAMLLDGKASIASNDRDPLQDMQALHTAVMKGRSDIVSLLLDRGADINRAGGEYGTALVVGAYQGRVQIVSLLIDRGADINIVGGKFGTALAAAAYGESMDIVSLLLDRGASINAVGGKYGTALATAAFKGTPQIVELLLDRGADVNAIGGDYGTALGMAAFRGRTAMVSLLLEHGADVMRVGGSYSTPSGVYPSALDAARSDGSRADPTLLELLETAVRTRDPYVDPQDIISRPPFPMPFSALVASHHRGNRTPSATISSFDPLSARFGNITAEHADIPCRELDDEVLWRSLAALVGLNEEAIHARRQWIQNDVSYFVSCNFDFGLAYAAARVAWKDFNKHYIDSKLMSIQRGQWLKHGQLLDEARSKVIKIDHSKSREFIESPYSIMPRRLWDLKSNRVVDYRMLHASQSTFETRPTFWAVSHTWTRDMSPIRTAVNHYQWPVPLPNAISLDALRSELLTLGAEYVWIDVVCLRQKTEDDHNLELLRRKEWKIDTPTIGNIFRGATKIVRYFNGLGVPFSNTGWDDPQHWLHQAWTLQEIGAEEMTINGGIQRSQGQVFLDSLGKVCGQVIKLRSALRPVKQLAAQVDSPRGCEVYALAQEMSRRFGTQPIDKISGLFYLLRITKLPCYDESMTSEGVWTEVFPLLPFERKIEILFDFPYRGSDRQWFPTWAQVQDWPTRDPEYDHLPPQGFYSIMNVPGEIPLFVGNIWTIPHANINENGRWGQYEVLIGNKPFGFYQPYLSQKPIRQGQPIRTITLAIADLGHAHNWLVCEALGKQIGTDFGLAGVGEVNVLKKVGVIRTDSVTELVVGGEDGVSLLQKVDCLFV